MRYARRKLDLGAVPSEFDSATAEICASPTQSANDSTAQSLVAAGFAGVIGLAAFLFFFHLGTYGLWEPDEARYSEIAREMLASHNFIVPHLNYVPYIEKPPLLYWLTTLAMRLLGVNEFAARFVNALAALFGVAAICFFIINRENILLISRKRDPPKGSFAFTKKRPNKLWNKTLDIIGPLKATAQRLSSYIIAIIKYACTALLAFNHGGYMRCHGFNATCNILIRIFLTQFQSLR